MSTTTTSCSVPSVMIEIYCPLRKFSISLTGEVHIGARALLDILLIWLGFIACLSQWEGEGFFTCSNEDYLSAFAAPRGSWGVGSAPFGSGPPTPVLSRCPHLLLFSIEQGKGQCQRYALVFFYLKKVLENRVSRETSLKDGYKYPGGKFKGTKNVHR